MTNVTCPNCDGIHTTTSPVCEVCGRRFGTTKVACPACSSTSHKPRADLGAMIVECRTCGAIHGTAYLGESYGIVKPFFAPAAVEASAVDAGTIRYFDLETLGSAGKGRRHGWYDTASRLITQVG